MLCILALPRFLLPSPHSSPSRPTTTRATAWGGEAIAVADAAGDEEFEALLRNFHRFSQGCKDALMEAQAFRVSYSSESKKCQAFESHIADLKTDNKPLRRLYTETLFKFTNQMKFHTESQSLKEELGKANSRLLSMEEKHKREIELLKHGNEMNSNALESKLSCSLVQQATGEAGIKQLKLELGAPKAHIDMLSSRLEQVTADVHLQYKNELLDLKDVTAVEQEEEKDLHRKLQNAENELRIVKMKQAEQQRDSISVQYVETPKQKVMKLRKEKRVLEEEWRAVNLIAPLLVSGRSCREITPSHRDIFHGAHPRELPPLDAACLLPYYYILPSMLPSTRR